MSETNVTDQRPRTTKAEVPEKMRALTKPEKDPEVQAFIQRLKARFLERVTEGEP